MAIKIQNMGLQKLTLVLGFMLVNDQLPCSASLNLNSDDPKTQYADHESIQSNIQFQRNRIDLVNNGVLILSPQINQSLSARNSSSDSERAGTQLKRSSSYALHNTQYPILTLESIPIDSWRQIVSYLTSTTKLHHVNRYFFTLLTDYSLDHIYKRGFINHCMLNHPSRLQIQGYHVDFDRIIKIGNHDIDAIPSYVWYSLTGTTTNLPISHYDNLIGTRIHTFLYRRGCTDDDVDTLSRTLRQTLIHTLKLKSENLVHPHLTVKGTQALATLINLTALDVEDNNIGKAGARSLAALTNLTSLSIEDNNIGEAGAGSIAALTNLTALDIGSNNIEEAGVRSLAALTNLTSLNIGSNKIGNAGAIILTKLTDLTILNVGDNQIGESVEIDLRQKLNHTQVYF